MCIKCSYFNRIIYFKDTKIWIPQIWLGWFGWKRPVVFFLNVEMMGDINNEHRYYLLYQDLFIWNILWFFKFMYNKNYIVKSFGLTGPLGAVLVR